MTADRVTYRAHVAPSTPVVALVTPDDVPDTDGNAYLSLAHADLSAAIHWLALALKGRDDLTEALGLELDTLRGVLSAIEQEREVLP